MSFEQLHTYYMARTEHTLRVRDAHRQAALGDHRTARKRRRGRPTSDD